MTDRTDTFNRANTTSGLGTPSDAGSNWVCPGGTLAAISSNQAYTNSASSPGTAYLESSIADAVIQVTIATHVSSSYIGLIARYVDESNYLFFRTSPSGWQLIKLVGGSETSLSTASGTPASADVLRLEVNGTSLSGYVNGALQCSASGVTDHQTSTKHGLVSYGYTSARYDDFSITAFSGGSTYAPPAMRRAGTPNVLLTSF